MEKVQRDFIRIVYKRSPLYQKNSQTIPPYTDMLATFGLETLEAKRLKICLNLFHKYLVGLLPISPTESFKFVPSKIRCDPFKIVPQFSTKDIRYNSFFIRMARIFGQLPPDLRNSSHIDFPKLLDKHDLSKYTTLKPDTKL
jgi:hypothetical protein